ncbi:MAG: DUF502 domain-containing protein [Magnetospirillum sp. WYHS-4]
MTHQGQQAPNGEHRVPRLGLGVRLRNYFITGILVTAPISLTFWLVWQFVRFVDGKVTPLIPHQYLPENYLPFGIPGFGVVIAVATLTLIGFATAGFLGRLLVRFYEGLLSRMPIVRSVYNALKQIIETVLAQKSRAVGKPVLVQYPRSGAWTIAFMMGESEGEICRSIGGNCVTVYVPTTPNPTSGFLLYLPRDEVMPLSMTSEEAWKMVISLGIVVPADRGALPPA